MKLRTRIMWAGHNVFAHPLMEILSWIGFRKFGERIHDLTTPKS